MSSPGRTTLWAPSDCLSFNKTICFLGLVNGDSIVQTCPQGSCALSGLLCSSAAASRGRCRSGVSRPSLCQKRGGRRGGNTPVFLLFVLSYAKLLSYGLDSVGDIVLHW